MSKECEKNKERFSNLKIMFLKNPKRQTPLGYAVQENKLGCVDAISSMDGVDLSQGV